MKTYTTSKYGFGSDFGRKTRRVRTLYLENSLEEFAKKLGISKGYLNQIELGRVQPSRELKLKIEYYMDMFGIKYAI